MDDKDRLGRKLHDKEKAEENLFIAEQERLKLEKLRKALAAAPPRGICPRDGETLVKSTHSGFTIDTCPTCHGVWLDKGELDGIVRRDEEPAVTRWIRAQLMR